MYLEQTTETNLNCGVVFIYRFYLHFPLYFYSRILEIDRKGNGERSGVKMQQKTQAGFRLGPLWYVAHTLPGEAKK